jgi:hypothetical protein
MALKIRSIMSSSRLFTKATNDDFSNRIVGNASYNAMTASYESKEYLLDSEMFGYTGHLVYQVDQLKGDVDDLHKHISASQYAPLQDSQLQATTGSFNMMDAPGAIVGYTINGLNVGHSTYDLTTSYAVPDSNMNVTFRAPLSGIVEIEIQIQYNCGTSGKYLYFGLSDNATYNAVQDYYEQSAWFPDESDDIQVTHKWVVSGLTAGNTYQYWLGSKTSSTLGTPKLQWGGNSANRYADFIMKVTALPSNTYIET